MTGSESFVFKLLQMLFYFHKNYTEGLSTTTEAAASRIGTGYLSESSVHWGSPCLISCCPTLLFCCTGLGETNSLRMRNVQELAVPPVAPMPTPHLLAQYHSDSSSHTRARTRSVSGCLSGDVGVCPRRGTGWFSVGGWIVQEVPDEDCVIM